MGDVVNGAGAVPLRAPLRTDLVVVARELGLHVDPAVLARAVMLWAVLIGAVSLEVFGQYGPDTFAEPGLLFEHQIRSALAALQGRTTGTSAMAGARMDDSSR